MNASIVRRLRHLQKWDSGTVRILGLIELLMALTLIVTSTYAIAIGDDRMPFVPLIPIVGGCGLFQVLFFSSKKQLTPALGVLLIAEMWIIAFVVAAIPYIIYGFSPIDSFFEAISGYTTTGATICPEIEKLPRSLLLWRAITQWAGGITVLISFSLLLPMIGMGGAGLNSNEFAGSDNDGYSLKISSASLNFLKVYVLLTVAEILCLLACGLKQFDAICIAMSNIPTGGLLPYDDSMASFNRAAQGVTMIFMVLGSANFYLMFRLFFKRDVSILKNKETRAMLMWFAACTLLVFLFYIFHTSVEGFTLDDYGESMWKSLYAVISSGTGTGFGIMDYFALPQFVFLILLVVEFMGGASGSTAGGIKIYRLMAIYSYIRSNLNRVLHPNAVVSIRSDGKNMNDDAVSSALATILLFLIGMFVGLALLMLAQPDIGSLSSDNKLDELQTYWGVTLAAIANAGIGPFNGCYAALNDLAKIIMCFLMWLGRMEMVLVLILFTRGFWTDVRLSVSKIQSGKKPRHRRNF